MWLCSPSTFQPSQTVGQPVLVMQPSDLPLHAYGFVLSIIPGLSHSAPPEVPLSLGFVLLTTSIISLTWHPSPTWAIILRSALAPLAIYFFLIHAFWPYDTAGVGVDVGFATIGLYWIMRVVETTFVGFMDERPPHWIVEGKEVPLPRTFMGRLAYSIDLASSLRGTSWFSKTHWDWAPKALLNSPARLMSRTQFLWLGIRPLILQYLAMDVIDAIQKSRNWDQSNPHSITSLPWHEQLVFSVSVCAQTVLRMTVLYTLFSCICVTLGSYPESWPPMFDAPFSASSLADFWTRRWHTLFRRVFDRLSKPILHILINPRSTPPSLAQRTVRSVVIFGISALVHMLLMYRIDMLETEYPRRFLDRSILKFFLSQPVGLILEELVVLPARNTFVPVGWRGATSRLYTWVFLSWSGRFWSDAWVHRGFWDEKERAIWWSVVRGVLYGKWAV